MVAWTMTAVAPSSASTSRPGGRAWCGLPCFFGCSPAEAEDVVQAALTRCLVNWSKVRRADDRDAYVHRVNRPRFSAVPIRGAALGTAA
jgi:hypothetical protein